MFVEMLDRRLMATYAVTIVQKTDRYRIDDTLVFQLSEGQYYQLLIAQVEKALRKMVDETDVVLWGEYEADPQVELELIEIDAPRPGFLISEIKEYWADDGEKDFLMGVVFADFKGGEELSILTGGTEAEIVTPELFATAITEVGFPIRTVRLVSLS
jgi:hypothetical protein